MRFRLAAGASQNCARDRWYEPDLRQSGTGRRSRRRRLRSRLASRRLIAAGALDRGRGSIFDIPFFEPLRAR